MDAADDLGEYEPPTLAEIMDVVERHIDAVARLRGERYGSQDVRKHVVRYFRDFPGAAAMRRRLFAVETGDEMLAELAALRREADLRLRPRGGDLPAPEYDADAEPGLGCGLDQEGTS